jgi:hypothetical protein
MPCATEWLSFPLRHYSSRFQRLFSSETAFISSRQCDDRLQKPFRVAAPRRLTYSNQNERRPRSLSYSPEESSLDRQAPLECISCSLGRCKRFGEVTVGPGTSRKSAVMGHACFPVYRHSGQVKDNAPARWSRRVAPGRLGSVHDAQSRGATPRRRRRDVPPRVVAILRAVRGMGK